MENTINSLNIPADKPIVIAGPTASGKSDLALGLAQKFNGMIINADALQVYECWRVLTARPDHQAEQSAPHKLYGHVGKHQSYSVGDWLRDVAIYLHPPHQKLPIIVGGTGLYLSSLTNGLADVPKIPDEIRDEAENILKTEGYTYFLTELEKCDPTTVSRLDTQNPVRVQRAWEVYRATGKGLSFYQDQTPAPLLSLDACTPLLIDAPREDLTPRIEARFRKMVTHGALAECRHMMHDWAPEMPSSRAIGARELIAHLRGEITLDTAIDLATIATRQYAKRQRSWFRARMSDWTSVGMTARR